MSHFSCLVQEDSAAARLTGTLEHRLAALHRSHFPDDAVTVSWRVVPRGHMFTEGRPSTTSIIVCRVSHVTTLEQRESYMRGICELWTATTGCTDHEVVVSIHPSPPA